MLVFERINFIFIKLRLAISKVNLIVLADKSVLYLSQNFKVYYTTLQNLPILGVRIQ